MNCRPEVILIFPLIFKRYIDCNVCNTNEITRVIPIACSNGIIILLSVDTNTLSVNICENNDVTDPIAVKSKLVINIKINGNTAPCKRFNKKPTILFFCPSATNSSDFSNVKTIPVNDFSNSSIGTRLRPDAGSAKIASFLENPHKTTK